MSCIVLRGFNKPVTKRNRRQLKQPSITRLLVSFGLLILLDVIWGLVSLHAWLYLCAGIAVFYTLNYLFRP